jgi:transposase-like protein
VIVDHVTMYRSVQRFTPEFVEAARPRRRCPGDRWVVDETYVKVAGQWTYLYRAIDQHGQVVDIWLSRRRDLTAARAFFARALAYGTVPAEVTTDRAPTYPRVLDEPVPSALHTTEQYANNRVEDDHRRLKARLRPMLGLERFRSARVLAAGHAFVQNLRRGHYEIAIDRPPVASSCSLRRADVCCLTAPTHGQTMSPSNSRSHKRNSPPWGDHTRTLSLKPSAAACRTSCSTAAAGTTEWHSLTRAADSSAAST